MLENYYKSAKERADMGIPPLPLDAEQTSQLVELIKKSDGKNEELLTLLTERVPAGVDDAAYVKAAFLSDVAKKNIVTNDKKYLAQLLGLKAKFPIKKK